MASSQVFQSTPSLRKRKVTLLLIENLKRQSIFQSTPSLRKVTIVEYENGEVCKISIHTFLAEGDIRESIDCYDYVKFQSTPSLRKVTNDKQGNASKFIFQSTPSLRKVTALQLPRVAPEKQFQSTPSLRKVTRMLGQIYRAEKNFNPHLPCGR